MNKQSATRQIALVAKSLSRIYNAEVNAHGMIFPDDIGNKPRRADNYNYPILIILYI